MCVNCEYTFGTIEHDSREREAATLVHRRLADKSAIQLSPGEGTSGSSVTEAG